MKLSDLTLGSVEIVQGMEKRLKQRRRNATAALGVAGAGILLQVFLAATDDKYLQKLKAIGQLADKLVGLDFPGLVTALASPEGTGALLLVGGLFAYLTLRWTGILMRESEECFRYSFHVDNFALVDGTPGERCKVEQDDRLKLLSRDLIERLNNRIRRLSILNLDAFEKGTLDERNLAAHIHIGGWYVVRETEKGKWVLQVTSNIRIGAKERPSTQTPPVKYTLRTLERSTPDIKARAKTETSESRTDTGVEAKEIPLKRFVLTADDYNQLVERVYSHVATEVYRQIEEDIRAKVQLFPTAYLRAVALSREAEDFANSNTIDAYDRALELYRQALRYFDVADVKPVTSFCTKRWLLWRLVAAYIHRKAAVVTGYARCVVYRRKLSALTGRYRNSMFEVPGLLDEVIEELKTLHAHVAGTALADARDYNRALLTFPKDLWSRAALYRPGELLFEKQRKALFDALVARALAYHELEAAQRAKKDLDLARAVDPIRSERDPLYLLAAAELEADLDKTVGHVEKAAQLDPEFQIARFRLAFHKEMRFRSQDDLTADKAKRVITAYDEVLSLNPGNIAALAAQGHLHWLLNQPDGLDKFEQGLELKYIVEETFVGELNYGLARIAAEKGLYFDCYDYYMEAVAADPGIASYSSVSKTRPSMVGYEYIGDEMIARFEKYKDSVLADLESKRQASVAVQDNGGKTCSPRTLAAVRSFVLNDYGNACFQYSFRHGKSRYLRKAIDAFTEAKEADSSNAVAQYDLAYALLRYNEPVENVTPLLQSAESLAPTWPVARTGALLMELTALQTKIGELVKSIDKTEKRRKELAARRVQMRLSSALGTMDELTSVDERLAALIADGRDDNIPAAAQSQVPAPFSDFLPALQSQRQPKLEKGNSAPWGETIQSPRLDVSLSDEIAQRELATLRGKLNEARNLFTEKVLPRLQAAISETRFGPLIDTRAVNYDGAGVSADILSKIKKECLDQNDVEVLRLWAEVLWTNTGNDDARRAARSLSQLHKSYFPEHFDRAIQILDAHGAYERRSRELSFSNAGEPGGDRGSSSPSHESGSAAKDLSAHRDNEFAEWLTEEARSGKEEAIAMVRRWLEEDPIHCGALQWLGDTRLALASEASRSIFDRRRRDTAGCRVELASIQLSASEVNAAISNLRSAAATDPKEGSFHYELGNVLQFSQQDYAAAAESYRAAIRCDDKKANYHARLGEALTKRSEWEAACDAFRRAAQLDVSNNGYRTLLKLAYNDWGNSLFDKREYGPAALRYKDALDVDDTDPVIHSNRSSALEHDTTDPDATRKAIDSLKRKMELAPDKKDVAGLRRLEERQRLLPFIGAKAAIRLPIVTPIALEVAADLIPLVQSGDKLSAEMEACIKDMRESLRKEFGVDIPGIRVRGNETDLPHGTYIIMMMEVPLVSGNVYVGKVFVREAADNLAALDVAAEDAVDPRYGLSASWVAAADRGRLEARRYKTMSVVDYVTEHLRAVIESNLADFMGIAETRALIEAYCPGKLADLERLHDGLPSFRMVLSALLAEEVPIVPLGLLAEQFVELQRAGATLPGIVEGIRGLADVRARLIGNLPGVQLYELDPGFEAAVRHSIHESDRVPVLAMAPDQTQECLHAVRRHIGSNAVRAAVVVSDATIRAHVRKLVEMEFPRLSVLAAHELLRSRAGVSRVAIMLKKVA